jgi:hypothetical protein
VDAPWGLLGLLLGGLTLCKYQALPLLGCLLIWALCQPERRRRLFSAEGVTALAAWALVSSPLWIWNAQHGWISILFHGARTSAASGFNPSGPPLFLLTQMLALFPSIGVLLLLGAGPHRPDRASPFRLLLRWLALPQMLLFLLLAGRMQVLVSWLVPVWWLLLPLAGERLAAAQAGHFLLHDAGLARIQTAPAQFLRPPRRKPATIAHAFKPQTLIFIGKRQL